MRKHLYWTSLQDFTTLSIPHLQTLMLVIWYYEAQIGVIILSNVNDHIHQEKIQMPLHNRTKKSLSDPLEYVLVILGLCSVVKWEKSLVINWKGLRSR